MIDFKIVENNTSGVKLAGVGQSDVEPPSTQVCREGMKVTDRFFYVKRGCIHFDLPGERQLEACAARCPPALEPMIRILFFAIPYSSAFERIKRMARLASRRGRGKMFGLTR